MTKDELLSNNRHKYPQIKDEGVLMSIILREQNICPCCYKKDVTIVNTTTFICSRCGGEYIKFDNPIKQTKVDTKPRQLTLF